MIIFWRNKNSGIPSFGGKQSCLKYNFGMLGNWTDKETFFDFYLESIAFRIKKLINITLF